MNSSKEMSQTEEQKKQLDILIVTIHDACPVTLHPRDPHQALKEQKDMICKLKDQGYES